MAVVVPFQGNDDLLSSSSNFLHSIYESQPPHIPDCSSEDSLAGISINLLSKQGPAVNSNLQKKTAIMRPKSSPVSIMASRALRRERCEVKLTLQQLEFRPQAWECETEEETTVASAAVRHSGMAVRPSSAAVRHSGMAVRPNSVAVRPHSAAVRPNSVAVRPNSAAVRPNSAAVRPNSAAVRPNSAVVRSNSADLWLSGATVHRSVRPSSAVTRSSRAAVRPGNQSSARPSSAAVVRPRPPSAPGQRKARPKTALGINQRSSVVLVDLEEDEELQKPFIRTAPPVNLTDQPEFFNFWLGKPLLERDSGVVVHKRKKWKRPQSDYGRRRSKRNGGIDGGDDDDDSARKRGLETVVETDTDGLDASTKRGGRFGDHDDNEQNSSITDSASQGVDQLDTNNRSGEGGEGGNGEGTEGGGGGKTKGKRPKKSDKKSKKSSKKKAALKAVSGALESTEDDYFNDSHLFSWLDSKSSGSKSPRNSRFELPVDLTTLTDMSPLQYLRKHCIISDRWKTYSSPIFTEFDKDKDLKLDFEELKSGLIKAHHFTITADQVVSVLDLVHASSDLKVDIKLFGAFCCLTERLLDLYSIHIPLAGKDLIEKVDFEGLNWKLRDCNINTPLHNLLTFL